MNKKRLSVVMAGAMLASSVAPVMAAEATTEATKVSANELGLLQEEVREIIENAPKFANEAENAPLGKEDVRNQSIYVVVINGKVQPQLTANASTQTWQDAFNALKVGNTVQVYDRGSKEVDGKYYHYETKKSNNVYDANEIKKLAEDLEKLETPEATPKTVIKNVELNNYSVDGKKQVVIEFYDDVEIPGLEIPKTMTIKEGDKEIVWETSQYAANHGLTKLPKIWTNESHTTTNVLSKWTKATEFFGFVLDKTVNTTPTEIATKVVKDYVITPGGYNYDVADLYDGLFLTDAGKEFLGTVKDGVAAGRRVTVVINNDGTTEGVNYYKVDAKRSEANIKKAENDIKGNLKKYKETYRFEVKLAAKDQLKAETYVISGKDKDEVARLASWMLRPQARVDKFEGSNRYETAVLLAKEYAGLTRDSLNLKDNGKYNEVTGDVNIVLVNGEALVDGLAAAPLAAKKANTVNKKSTSAPVLLTYADRLPKETKAYLREVLSNIALGDVPNVTINLVGGETVLTESLEKELKAIGFHGFKVERFGGDNREETSLEVAKEIGGTKAFVVGGEGEADAMSIASVAATQQTPIIVAKKGGISEDGIYEVRDKDVMIVGGKTVVTLAEENEIRTEAKSVNRIQGANRKATNAEVIKRYYNEAGFANGVGNAQNVIVAKDGQRREIDLVDALAAANMASEKKAPIVLATNKLSKEQEAAIKSYANDAYGLFQVGGQVERSVVKTIAKMLNLTNRNTK